MDSLMDSLDNVPDVADVDSCMNYLREASLYKMMNDPNHRAMLFLLEVLMDCVSAMTIEELAAKLFSDGVSADIQLVCGGDIDGLRAFMEKYPSLFRIDGRHVSPIDVSELSASTDQLDGGGNGSCSDGDSSRFRRPIDLAQETEAVKYFQFQLSKREDHWVSLKSLAGHLSQASESIRRVVGPQALFHRFIQRHPHVFEVQGDLVSLRDNFSTICLATATRTAKTARPTATRPRSAFVNSRRTARPAGGRPTSMVIECSSDGSPKDATRPGSLSAKSSTAIDSREFQAAMFLKTIIGRKSGGRIGISHLFLYLGQAPSSVRDCIGWTKIELEEFIRKQSTLFDIDKKGQVTSIDTDEISIVVNDNVSAKDGIRTIINQRGSVYHVTKLWGIIDLGQHEHVFFDKSIFKHLDDLQRHFQIGEFIYFNAILAPKQSRAKWRATQVWKESDVNMVQKFSGDLLCTPKKPHPQTLSIDNDSVSSCRSLLSEQRHIIASYHDIDEELAEILQLSKIDSEDDCNHSEYECHQLDLGDYSVTTVPSPSPSSTECLSSSSGVAGEINSTVDMSRPCSSLGHSHRCRSTVTMVSVATQTISTGDIMAVQVYLELPHDRDN